jgi:hypothetical protein
MFQIHEGPQVPGARREALVDEAITFTADRPLDFELARRPAGSAATFAGSSSTTESAGRVTFTPDRAGIYHVKVSSGVRWELLEVVAYPAEVLVDRRIALHVDGTTPRVETDKRRILRAIATDAHMTPEIADALSPSAPLPEYFCAHPAAYGA